MRANAECEWCFRRGWLRLEDKITGEAFRICARCVQQYREVLKFSPSQRLWRTRCKRAA